MSPSSVHRQFRTRMHGHGTEPCASHSSAVTFDDKIKDTGSFSEKFQSRKVHSTAERDSYSSLETRFRSSRAGALHRAKIINEKWRSVISLCLRALLVYLVICAAVWLWTDWSGVLVPLCVIRTVAPSAAVAHIRVTTNNYKVHMVVIHGSVKAMTPFTWTIEDCEIKTKEAVCDFSCTMRCVTVTVSLFGRSGEMVAGPQGGKLC